MEKQELRKRFEELIRRSYRENVFYFTNFLSPSDAAIAYELAKQNEMNSFGGANGCERVVIRFGDPETFGYEEAFPISVIKIEPRHLKYADALTHRDYLGALMNLGIERDLLGDIVVRETHAYLFSLSHIAPFICENLRRIKHTDVACAVLEEAPEDAGPHLVRESLNVSAVRIDSIIARLYHLSRGSAQQLITGGDLLVNGRSVLSVSYQPKPDDVCSLRGYGKFIYRGELHETKKGRLQVAVDRYD